MKGKRHLKRVKHLERLAALGKSPPPPLLNIAVKPTIKEQDYSKVTPAVTNEVKPETCGTCSTPALKSLTNVQKEKGPLRCDPCEKVFLTEHARDSHMRG